jgi:MFS transporter, FHS family, L-fucose permease
MNEHPSPDPLTSATGATGASPSSAGQQTYPVAFAIMTSLFFMWGFMEAWNDLLIARFKEAFTLSYFQAMLVQLAFFVGYFTGSLIYYLISMTSGDPINRIGYKNGVMIGLLIAGLGCFLFYPAAVAASYPFFLAALFILALGLAMLQIACNPYVTILGPEKTASSRLNLSQGFNSVGGTIGPIIGGWLIFIFFTSKGAHGSDSVKIPYLCLGGVFVLLAVFFKFAHLPAFTNTGKIDRGLGALKHPHTVLGMSAIFMYVGGEVSIGSAMINYLGLPQLGGLSHEVASKFLSLYWGGFMIGRFMGGFALSAMKKVWKNSLVALVPVVAFFIIWAVSSQSIALHCGAALIVLLVAFYLGEASAHRMLALFSSVIIGLILTSMCTTGETAKWSILAVGLFGSVMWSNIFSLAIEGLGPQKSQASSLLIMAVLGGALLPPLQGWIADHHGIQTSFIVPMAAFAYIAFYGIHGYKVGRTAKAPLPA